QARLRDALDGRFGRLSLRLTERYLLRHWRTRTQTTFEQLCVVTTQDGVLRQRRKPGAGGDLVEVTTQDRVGGRKQGGHVWTPDTLKVASRKQESRLCACPSPSAHRQPRNAGHRRRYAKAFAS